MDTPQPPLSGLKVLELGGLAPSPFAGLILADYGATVVRVDRTFNVFGPPRDTLCRRKRSVVIDLKNASSRRVFLELVKVADVLIDPYRPDVMARLGLGPETLCRLNDRLIYAHLYGFRPDGVYGTRAGHDINYLAVAGILSILGRRDENPTPPANILGDFAGGGLVCVAGILFALIHRQTTGKGQVVSVNMVDGSAYLATFMRQQQGHENNDRPRGENLLDGAAPFYEVYKTSDDRFVAVGAQEPQFYELLLKGMGLDANAMPAQWDRNSWPRTKALFANVFRQKTRDEWQAIFDGTDACVSPVLDMDETEQPFKPLVELSASPSLDVSVQESYPELKKGEGGEGVLNEWMPHAKDLVDIDPSSKLLTMRHAAKL
jgi:alpha-methylacyl-CoA racemase